MRMHAVLRGADGKCVWSQVADPVLREDEVVPSYPREEILYNAESQDDGYFLVKKRS